MSAFLKKAGFSVYQDKANINTPYPYLVYSFVSEKHHTASNQISIHFHSYQLSLFTTGSASELKKLTDVLDENGLAYERFQSTQGDENDDTVTNFFTYFEVLA